MIAKDEIRKSILRVLIGEVDTFEARGKSASQDVVNNIINKLISSNEEIIKVKPSDILVKENDILKAYLPKYLTEDEIEKFFVDQNETATIKNAENDGKAMGLAMKIVKSHNLSVLSEEVKKFVNKVRVNG
jgi:uncharacterized protein YqeY